MRGLDGKWYNNDHDGQNERIAADARWRQQQEQNRLLKEQNRLKEKELKMQERELNNRTNYNYNNSGMSSNRAVASAMISNSNSKYGKKYGTMMNDKFMNIVILICCSFLFLPFAYCGIFDMIIAMMLGNSYLTEVGFETNPIGSALTGLYIVIIIWKICSYRKMRKDILTGKLK